MILAGDDTFRLAPPRLDAGLLPETNWVGIEDFWSWFMIPLTRSVVALSLLIAGGFYVRSHERLDYANLGRR